MPDPDPYDVTQANIESPPEVNSFLHGNAASGQQLRFNVSDFSRPTQATLESPPKDNSIIHGNAETGQQLRFLVSDFSRAGYAGIRMASNSTPTPISGSSSDWSNAVKLPFDTDSPIFQKATPDAANDQVIVGVAGVYFCIACLSFTGGNNVTYSFKIFQNDKAVPLGARTTRKVSGGGEVGEVTVIAPGIFEEGDTVAVWAQNEDNVQDITVEDSILTVIKIS